MIIHRGKFFKNTFKRQRYLRQKTDMYWIIYVTGILKSCSCSIFKVLVSARNQERMFSSLFSLMSSTIINFFFSEKCVTSYGTGFKMKRKVFISTYVCLIVLWIDTVGHNYINILNCWRNYYCNNVLLIKTDHIASLSICGPTRDGPKISGHLLVSEVLFQTCFCLLWNYSPLMYTIFHLQYSWEV